MKKSTIPDKHQPMIDQFTAARAKKLLSDWKQRHGRDINRAELESQGFPESVVDELVRSQILIKYQVTSKGGRTENRYKLVSDWRSIKQ
jgi:hypothetical protein